MNIEKSRPKKTRKLYFKLMGVTELIVYVAVPGIISGTLVAVCVICIIRACDRRQPQVHISPLDEPEVHGVEQAPENGVGIEIPSPMEPYLIDPYAFDLVIFIPPVTFLFSLFCLYAVMRKRRN